MEHHQQLLSAYQQIHTLSEQMITLAQAGQWDALIEMEIGYVQAVEKPPNWQVSLSHLRPCRIFYAVNCSKSSKTKPK